MRPILRLSRVFPLFIFALVACDPGAGGSAEELTGRQIEALVDNAAEGEHRSAANRERNRYRNPGKTMAFFGLQPHWTVVEVWPGGGWYTEVLAPVLREQGKLIAASYPEDAEGFRGRIGRQYAEKLRDQPDIYDRVQVLDYGEPGRISLGEPDSADMVLLSRHFHNFIRDEIVDQVLDDAREVLRPGGVLAVIQHRADRDAEPEAERRTGYVRQPWLIDRVQQAGFELDGVSEVNANRDDTGAHPAGVWTLPPSLRHCEGMEDDDERAACEDKYRAIGESDRMTLRFIKPE